MLLEKNIICYSIYFKGKNLNEKETNTNTKKNNKKTRKYYFK